VEIWPDIAPLACENFLALVTGEKGISGGSGKKLHYAGCPFHRIVPDFVAQAGDISFGNGTGGESIWGKKFNDDQKGLKQKFSERGLLAMGNTGKNANTSQFFFSLDALPKLVSGGSARHTRTHDGGVAQGLD
jgi:cyclophilin family peptidyl-prolyl cis-trans isomerase